VTNITFTGSYVSFTIQNTCTRSGYLLLQWNLSITVPV